MEFVWMAVGAGVLGLVLWFRATKKRVRDAAHAEVAMLLKSIGDLSENGESPARVDAALRHVTVYLKRSSDYASRQRGIPPDRALMAGFWHDALGDLGYLEAGGTRLTETPTQFHFWQVIDSLRLELDMRSYLAGGRNVR